MHINNAYDDKLSTTLLISVVYPLGSAAILLMPMIIGGVIDHYDFSERQAGALGSLEGMGVVISSLTAAVWIRRISWTKVLLISFLLTALLNVLSAHVSEPLPLIIIRFLAGLTGGAVFAVTVAALGDNRQPDRAFGIAQSVQGVMLFLAFSSSPYLIKTWGVSGIFYMLAGACILMMLSLFRFPSRGVDHSTLIAQHVEHSSSSALLIWLGLIGSVIYFINVFGFWAFIERIGDAAGLPGRTIGLALGSAQIIAVGGAIAAALASDRFGRTLPLLVVLAGQALVLWLLLGQFTSTTFFIGVGVFQALFMMAVCYQMGAIAKIDLNGRYLVLMTAAQGLGAAFGPSIAAAAIGEGQDYSGIHLVSGLTLLAGILIFLVIVHYSRNLVGRPVATAG